MTKESFRKCLFFSIFINIVAISFGIAYLTIPEYNVVWDIFGVVMVLAWLGNFVVISLTNKYVNKANENGKFLNRIIYIYLVFIISAFLCLTGNGFLLMGAEVTSLLGQIGSYLLIGIGFFGVLIFGLYLTFLDLIKIDERGAWNFE